MKMIKNVLSLFDGIACARLALERADIDFEKYYASEIEESSTNIAQKHFPDVVQLPHYFEVNYLIIHNQPPTSQTK